MIHHLARAFFVRSAAASNTSPVPAEAQRPGTPVQRPVRARPITPWGTPARTTPSAPSQSATVVPFRSAQASAAPPRHVRICTDPTDARRTVIAGRFAEVCAALDRLVMEQEAAA